MISFLRRHQTDLLSVLTIVMFALLPFVQFYQVNVSERIEIGALIKYPALTLLLALIELLVLKVALRRIESWKLAFGVTIQLVMIFLYLDLKGPAAHLAEKAGFGPVVPAQSLGFVIGFSAFLLTVPLAIAVWAAKRREAVSFAAMVGAALHLFALVGIFAFVLQAPPAPTAESERASAASEGSLRPRSTPNIYWIVLDAYPRFDVLETQFGFDNRAFQRALERQGFVVANRALANYPVTLNSVTSTLAMNYLIDETTPQALIKDRRRFIRVIQGQNPVVRTFRKWGYRYVHFSNGSLRWFNCPPETKDVICIKGEDVWDDLDVAILARTPVIDFVSARESWLSHRKSEQEQPETARAMSLRWGGLEKFEQKLDSILRLKAPYFVYAHVISPHPPIRFDADCDPVEADQELDNWLPEQRPAYVEQIKCVNKQVGRVIDRIVETDPNAMIVLQSDHGSAFLDTFGSEDLKLSDEQFLERYGALDALRVPKDCASSIPRDVSLVNTFKIVFACLTGRAPELLANRHFVVSGSGHEAFGEIKEYKPAPPVSK